MELKLMLRVQYERLLPESWMQPSPWNELSACKLYDDD